MNRQSTISNKKQKNNLQHFFTLKIYSVLFLIIAFLVIFLWSCSNLNINPQAQLLENIDSSDKAKIKTCPANISFIDSNKFLELINNDHPVNKGYSDYVTVSAFKVVPVVTSDLLLNQNALKAVKNLFNDAKKEGFANFFLNSGYRTYDSQKQLYDNAADKSYVQKPNCSEHRTGLAMDIACNGISGSKMAKSKEGRWLKKNAWRFGLILRYPDGKSEITKINYEPWHYRYIGLPHSYYCYKNNLCLEEYIQLVKDIGNYRINLDGIKYDIFYETLKNGMIQVPKNLDYEISDDNTGGYIITVKEK